MMSRITATRTMTMIRSKRWKFALFHLIRMLVSSISLYMVLSFSISKFFSVENIYHALSECQALHPDEDESFSGTCAFWKTWRVAPCLGLEGGGWICDIGRPRCLDQGWYGWGMSTLGMALARNSPARMVLTGNGAHWE